jgi:hypothetical protein
MTNLRQAAEMALLKRLRKPKIENGELQIYWGKETRRHNPDIIFSWQGDSSMKRDAAFLHYYLASKKPDLFAKPLFSVMKPSFFEELEERGYDLATLRFSIKRKNKGTVK